eukprot:8663547-Karenia_brevis.AAC.1
MYQATRSHEEQARSPQGQIGRTGRPSRSFMQLSPDAWTEGPHGLMSLGDMLSMAGFPAEDKEKTPLPPPPGP